MFQRGASPAGANTVKMASVASRRQKSGSRSTVRRSDDEEEWRGIFMALGLRHLVALTSLARKHAHEQWRACVLPAPRCGSSLSKLPLEIRPIGIRLRVPDFQIPDAQIRAAD